MLGQGLTFHVPGDRTAWSELWELTQAQGHLLQDAEVTLRVHRDLLEALAQVQVRAGGEEADSF